MTSIRQRLRAILRATWAVFLFESRRALQWQRLLLAAGLAVFPSALIALVEFQDIRLGRLETWPAVIFLLVPGLICGLNLLLWATPAIHAEVEGKTWSYLAVRPGGRTPILLGKYAAAVAWSLAVGLVGLTIALIILRPSERVMPLAGFQNRTVAPGFGAGGPSAPAPDDGRKGTDWSHVFFTAWPPFAAMVALSCLAYGSLYTLFGVIFLRRAMIWAVGYTIFFEIVVSMVPAMVNRLTVQYHLRNLLFRWTALRAEASRLSVFLDTRPSFEHILALVAYAVVLLAAAVVILRRRPLITVSDL